MAYNYAANSLSISGGSINNDSTINNHVPVVKSRMRKGGWRAAFFILATEATERLAFYSIAANLAIYLLTELHEPLPKAVTMITNWIGAAYMFGIPGGFVADAYLGRFRTIAIYSVCYIVGLVLMVLSATVKSLRPPGCVLEACPEPTRRQEGVLLAGLYLIAIGTGGIKPCVSAFGADQLEGVTGAAASGGGGARIGYDPKRGGPTASFFNWFFFSVNIGALFAFTVVVYIQDNVGWGPGLAIPLVGMTMSLLLLLSGTPLYVHAAPAGSPFTRFAQVIVSAYRHRHVSLPSDPRQLFQPVSATSAEALPHTDGLRCLDKAAVVEKELQEVEGDANPWHLCSITQVEEFKLFLCVLPIAGTTLFLWTGYTQLVTFFVKQGSTMDRKLGPHFEIPAASLPIFSVLNALLVLPFYDKVIVPTVSKLRNGRAFSPLQRMGFGLLVSILSMIVAALVERHRIRVATTVGILDNGAAVVPMSIFWLVPQYFLVGLSEIFTYVGQLEFFYAEVSHNMRSLSTSLFIAELGLGSWISSLLVTIVTRVTGTEVGKGWILDNLNRSHVDYFYWLLAVLGVINFFLFLFCASRHHYNTRPSPPLTPTHHELARVDNEP